MSTKGRKFSKVCQNIFLFQASSQALCSINNGNSNINNANNNEKAEEKLKRAKKRRKQKQQNENCMVMRLREQQGCAA